MIVGDNGTEFTSNAILRRTGETRAATHQKPDLRLYSFLMPVTLTQNIPIVASAVPKFLVPQPSGGGRRGRCEFDGIAGDGRPCEQSHAEARHDAVTPRRSAEKRQIR